MEPVFLSLDEVLEIHEQQIERYGGSPGLRATAGLESAVASGFRPFPPPVKVFF
jgi:death-on-curing protein